MSKEYTETWAEFLDRYPELVFVRTKKQIYAADEIDDNIVMEEDTLPLVKGKSVVIPIDESSFPRCFKTGSAMELGIWATFICEKNNWKVSPAMVREILTKQEEKLEAEENS